MHDGRATDDDNDIDHRLIDGDVLDGSSPTSPPTFSSLRRRARDVVLDGDGDGDIEVHDNCIRVHPTVNDEIARGMVEI